MVKIMQNKSRNKYSNKSLKQGYDSYNDYKGNQGYVKIVKPITFKTIMQCLCCFIVVAIIAFYLVNKFI